MNQSKKIDEGLNGKRAQVTLTLKVALKLLIFGIRTCYPERNVSPNFFTCELKFKW